MPGWLTALALLSVVIAPARAESRIYEWRDGNGTPNFGDSPPAASAEFRLRQTARAGATAAEPVAAAGPTDDGACERKRAQVDNYRRATTLTETNALGETREYSAIERQRLIEQTEAEARALCGDAP